MSIAGDHPYETILKLCQQSSPNPWLPGEFAASLGFDRRKLDHLIDELRIAGLIERAEWQAGVEQGYRLTRTGLDSLRSPRSLAQLRSGRMPIPGDHELEPDVEMPKVPSDRRAAVLACLRNDRRPCVTYAIVATIVIVFFIEAHISIAGNWCAKFKDALLLDHPTARHHVGAVTLDDLAKGQWWRLLTTIFVHRDIFQLLVYLSIFFRIGLMAERLWGHLRYLTVFLLTGFSSACVEILLLPAKLPYGAAGAIFGILFGLATWYALNKRYLPYEIYRMGMRAVVSTAVWWLVWFGLIAILVGQDMWWVGYIAGGVSGIFVVGILNQQQFIAHSIRWTFLVLLFILPVVLIGLLVRARDADPQWRAAETAQREKNESQVFNDEISPAIRDCAVFLNERWENIGSLISQPAKQRDPDEVNRAHSAIRDGRAQVEETLAIIARHRPYKRERVAVVVDAGEAYVKELQKLIDMTEHCLDAGEKMTDDQADELKKQARKTMRAKARYDSI